MVGGGASTPRVFVLLFQKQVKSSRKGTFQRLCRWEMPRSGKGLLQKQQGFNWFQRYCHRGTLIWGLQNLISSRKGTGLFFLLVRKERGVHQRSADLWTPGTVQIAGRYGIFDRFSAFRQVTDYKRTTILHNIGGNDLNRYELQALHKRICGFARTRSGFFW